jgi:hypothetical protein
MGARLSLILISSAWVALCLAWAGLIARAEGHKTRLSAVAEAGIFYLSNAAPPTAVDPRQTTLHRL